MPAPTERCVQESNVSDDPLPSDPRASLVAAIAAVAEGADLDGALSGLLKVTETALGASMGAFLIADPDRATMVLAASAGMDEAADARLASESADPANPFATAARERVATFDREATTLTGEPFTGAYLPLLATTGGVEVSLGAAGFGWPGTRVLTDVERSTLVSIAGLAALAVDRARLSSTAAERSEWFERMAHSDPLTGLANERTVARVLELELARAGRQGSEVSLAMFDIDEFQATNRDGGHAAGDDVLRRVAAVLAESVRLVDTVGRIGGDEFVLIAPGSAGLTIVNRVMDGIAALPAVAGRDVTISAGIARFPADGADSEALIAAATDALDRARQDGHGSVAETGSVPKG
jgi:diguanylate cyclase (GGDEF)-like protein